MNEKAVKALLELSELLKNEKLDTQTDEPNKSEKGEKSESKLAVAFANVVEVLKKIAGGIKVDITVNITESPNK